MKYWGHLDLYPDNPNKKLPAGSFSHILKTNLQNFKKS